MLSRVLEPEVMDAPDEAHEYDAMDHGDVNRRFVEDLITAVPRLSNSADEIRVLDLGTGTAQQPILLCRRSASVRVVATDAAESMLMLASRNIRNGRVADCVALLRCDAKGLPFADAEFPVVVSNSIVHHIPEPIVVFREAVRVTEPEGSLFFRDLLRPESEAFLRELVATYAGETNDQQRKLFEDSLRAALTIAEVADMVTSLGFGEQTVQQSSDRHWTWVARR